MTYNSSSLNKPTPLNHPLFLQPKYTKSQPKQHLSNPITGLTNRNENTLNRRMANYGEKLVSNK